MAKYRSRSGLPGLKEEKNNKRRNKRFAIATIILLIILIPLSIWLLSRTLVPDFREFHIPLEGADKGGENFLLTTGQKIIDSMLKNNEAELYFVDPQGNTPVIAFRIYKRGDWAKRNPYTQLSIATYLQSLVPQSKILVSKYLPQGRNTPSYDQIAHNIQAKLCTSCWAVIEGTDNPKYLVGGVKVIGAYPNAPRIETFQELHSRTLEAQSKAQYK